jgi:hypothetical protein
MVRITIAVFALLPWFLLAAENAVADSRAAVSTLPALPCSPSRTADVRMAFQTPQAAAATLAIDTRCYPSLAEPPAVQVFSGDRLTVEALLKLVAFRTGYALVIDPAADLTQPITINTLENPLEDISLYLDDFSAVQVSVFPESHTLLVLPNTRPSRALP